MRKLIYSSLAALGLSLATAGLANAGIVVVCAECSPLEEKSGKPTFMIGIAVEFGDSVKSADIGLTAKVISTNKPNSFAFGGGLSFFPWAKDQLGVDVDVGYNFNDVGAFAGYDVLRWKPQLSVGYVPTHTSYGCPPNTFYDPTNVTPPCNPNILSDSRLKREIRLVDTLDNGIKIYSFKYLWTEQTYVGVMAQDLLKDPRRAHAVVTQENGFYAVNYKELNLRMTTLENWQKQGRLAIALNASDGNPHIKKAA